MMSPHAGRMHLIMRLLASVLLLGGAALALWALTLPWHHYEPPRGLGLPPDPQTFIPAQAFTQPAPSALDVAYVCLPVALGVFGLIELSRPRTLWHTRVIMGIVLALLGAGMSVLLSWPGLLNDSAYTFVVDAGVNVSYLGYTCALFGSMFSIPARE